MFKIKNKYLTLLALGCLTTVPSQMAYSASGDITDKEKKHNFHVPGQSGFATRAQMATATAKNSSNKDIISAVTSKNGGVYAGCEGDVADVITDHDTATINCTKAFVETKADFYYLKNLLSSPSTTGVRINAVSQNGRKIVGTVKKQGTDQVRAAFWNVGADGAISNVNATEIPSIGSLNSWANAVSATGTYTVGARYINSNYHEAFRNYSNTTTNLGTLRASGGNSEALGTASNEHWTKLYVVGWSNKDSTTDQHGFIHQINGTQDAYVMIEINGTLRSGSNIKAYDISDDGLTVVGLDIDPNNSNHTRAFKWVRKSNSLHSSANGAGRTGIMTELKPLSTHANAQSDARAISDDGTTIVGWSHSDAGTTKRATRWTGANNTKVDLGTLKDDNSGNSVATAVSHDGKIIVGKADSEEGGQRAFIWKAGDIYDLVKSQSAVNQSSVNQSMATASMGQALSGALSYDFNVDAGSAGTKANAFMVSVNQKTNNECQFIDCNTISLNATDYGKILRRHGANTTVTYSKGDSGDLTVKSRQLNFAGFVRKPSANTSPIMLGAFLGRGSISSKIETLGFQGNVPSKGIYLRGLAKNGVGLSWKVGFAHAKGKAKISRAVGYKTDKASGTATMTSNAVSLSVGYSFPKWDTMYTPYATFQQSTATRGAYKETSGSFPVNYSALTIKSRTLQPGLRGETKASENSSFSWDLGLIIRMSESASKATGKSELKGFESFNIAAPKQGRKHRPTMSVGYNYDIKNDMRVFTNLNSTRSAHKSGLDKTYTIGFKMGL